MFSIIGLVVWAIIVLPAVFAIEAHGILRSRIAVLVHDCWAPYWDLECVHALCNAHLLRELLRRSILTS